MEQRRQMFLRASTSIRSSAISTILLLLNLSAFISYHSSFAVAERMFPIVKNMNIETCLVRFDVHLNTIIRTEESRSMGARFLDDADLNTREQCLRLCCETENCDVFVFEEKSPGTCFLFQCGPPENFRCKFTHHSNYTSAVLSMPPMEQQSPVPLAPPLTAQIQSLSAQQQGAGEKHLSQHEIELVNLKERAGTSKQLVPIVATFETMSTTLLPPLGVRLGEALSTSSVSIPKQHCGHFEFPCHSGECIAVYNVCDGIPQCEDGSDEGPDCPQKNSRSNNAEGALNQASGMVPSVAADRNGLGRNTLPINIEGGISSPKVMLPMYQPLDYQQLPNRFGRIDSEQGQLQQQHEQQEQQLNKPAVMHRNREDPMTAPKAWPRPGISELNYVDTTDSHIFSHKGGLHLSAANNIIAHPVPQFQESLPDPNYMPSHSVGHDGVGGQSTYMSLPGSNEYTQQMQPQIPPGQQETQYKSAISSQWIRGNSVPLPNWSVNSESDHQVGPPMQREQYIQPPVQQRHSAAMAQELPQPSSNVRSRGEDAAFQPMKIQQKIALTQTPPPSALLLPIRGQTHQNVPDSVVAPTSSSKFPGETDFGRASVMKETGNIKGSDQSSSVVAVAAETSNGEKHTPAGTQGATHDGDTEYEEDAYEDTYPETADGAEEATSVAEESTQTEPPKKKQRKHHKHDHADGKKTNPSTNNEQAPEKQKKKKKAKITKKEKAVDHQHGTLDDTIMHEHLKAALHKDLEIEFTDHDGYADRPGGAMLSLTLGVLLTAALGILLSCRMRVARRRIRRPGKSTYAHDADFLVNGMYL